MQKTGICAGILLAALLFCSSTANARCLKIASDTKGIKAIGIFKPGIEVAFKKAGICAEFINMPAVQAQKAIIRGKIDGEFIRVNAYINAMSKYVVAIPTPIISGNGYIITRSQSSFHPENLKDIADKHIGIIQGFKWHEVLSRHITQKTLVSDYKTLAQKLKNGEIDCFLTEDVSLGRLQKTGILLKKDFNKSKPVINLSGYLLLHKTNVGHLEKLNHALKILKARGWFKIP